MNLDITNAIIIIVQIFSLFLLVIVIFQFVEKFIQKCLYYGKSY